MNHEEGRSLSGPPKMRYEEYDEDYSLAFAQLVIEIRRVLPSIRVEHIGSTSVHGLGGRRILDGVIVSNPEDGDRIREKLLSIGFTDFPWANVVKSSNRISPMFRGTVQFNGKEFPTLFYLLPAEHEYVKDWIAFREYMRKHPEEVQRYAEVKRTVIASGQSDPASYQRGKVPLLGRPLEAHRWYGPCLASLVRTFMRRLTRRLCLEQGHAYLAW